MLAAQVASPAVLRRAHVRMKTRRAATTKALSLEADVVSPVKTTFRDVQTVSGAKAVAFRVAKFLPATAIAAARMAACDLSPLLAAAGLHAPTGLLAPVAEAFLFNPAAPWLQSAMGVAGMLGIGTETPGDHRNASP